jgi:thiol-disulfide isomerase/thioredoxin
MTGLSRRAFVGGAAGAALGPASVKSAPLRLTPMFAATPLRTNRIAMLFTAVDLALPDLTVIGDHGPIPLASIKGPTLLLSLWAEWCVPCLVEARDLAPLRRRFSGPRFDIATLLTGSLRKLDYAGARAKLKENGTGDLPLLVEPNGGHDALKTLSLPMGSFGALPCTLLVDRRGRVRGRAIGMAAFAGAPPSAGKVLSDADKGKLLESGRSAWASADGAAFVQALRDGALDRL